MITKSNLLLIFTFALGYLSCNKGTPAGFWQNFKENLLIKNISDQGPYGGRRIMYWKTEKINTFDSKTIIGFAIKNGWKLIDSLAFNQNQVSKWTYDNTPIFPLSHTGFSDTITNNSTYKHFPRWINGQIKIYKFKTGWVAIEPGTDNSIEGNGFVVVNENENEMSVYHLWGE